jgi:hypothetical protein
MTTFPDDAAATVLTRLSRLVATESGVPADRIATTALDLARDSVPGARFASLTYVATRPRTLAASDPRASAIDEFQYRTGSGPCLSAVATGATVTCDFETEDRWPAFTALAVADGSAKASLSLPLAPAGHDAVSLNLYTDAAAGSAGIDRRAAELATSALALVLTAVNHQQRMHHLEIALDSSRIIGAAIGILMHRHRWTYEQSFDALRDASQRDHRRLRDIADDVVMLGDLPG